MTRRLWLVPTLLAAVLLASCGDTCSSAPAPVNSQAVTNGCNASGLAAGAAVTINVPLCPQCTDTSPSCSGEVLANNIIELSSVVQQCSGNSGCSTTACSVTPVACSLNQALAAGTYTVTYLLANEQTTSESVTVTSGGPASCSL